MLCHDGASSISSSGGSSESSEEIIQPGGGDRSSKRVKRALFRSLISVMIDRGYNVALINGLEWMDTKVYLSTRPVAFIKLITFLGDGMGR